MTVTGMLPLMLSNSKHSWSTPESFEIIGIIGAYSFVLPVYTKNNANRTLMALSFRIIFTYPDPIIADARYHQKFSPLMALI